MKTLTLPKSEAVISKAVFGTSRLGGTIERFDKREALNILRTVLDAGIHTFDTADIYAQGNSERLLAEAFQGRRDEVVYATKGGYVLSGKARLLAKVKPLVRRFMKAKPGLSKTAGRARGGQMAHDFSREHMTHAVEASLKRLRTDTIDIYQLHSPTADHLRNSDAFETLATLKQAGKIRAYGVSLLSWDDLPLCIGRGVSWAQVDAELLVGRSHQPSLELAARDNLSLIARQVFGSGRLNCSPADLTSDYFNDDTAALERARQRLRALTGNGNSFESILRYFLHRAPFAAFLFATTRMANLRTNLEALNRGDFDEETWQQIAPAFQTHRH